MNISEAVKITGLTAATLRYYESEGLIPPVNRKNGGVRDYQKDDLGWIDFIKCMRNAGLPIEALIEYMTLLQQGDQTSEARKDILKEQREILAARLQEMQKTLELLDYKISVYEKKIMPKEKDLN